MKKWTVLALVSILGACDDPLVAPPTGDSFTHPAGTISSPETWSEGIHVVEGDLTLAATVTVEACSEIRMPIGGTITVSAGGALQLLGEQDCPVVVTSSQSVGSPGDWNSIEFYSESTGPENIFQYAVLEFGGGAYGAVWLDNGSSIEISNTVFDQNEVTAIFAEEDVSLRNFVGNTFTNTVGFPITASVTVAGDLMPATFTGNDQQAVLLLTGTVAETTTWRNLGVPYVAPSFYISKAAGGAVLTVEAGTTIAMQPDAGIDVSTNGGLTLAGTIDDLVTITSAKSAQAPGDWEEIAIYGDSVSSGNSFTYAVIEYSGGATSGSIWLGDGASVAITNSIVQQSGDVGIHVGGPDVTLREFEGNSLIDNAKVPISLPPSVVADLGEGLYTPNGIEGIQVTAGTVSENASWYDRGVRYLVTGDFTVDAGTGTTTLTLQPGVILAMDADTAIHINDNGRLIAAGIDTNHVTITSDEPIPSAGDWVEIDVYSPGNVFEYTDFSYGGGSIYAQMWIGGSAVVTMDHVIFSNSGFFCDVLLVSGGSLSATNSTYEICP